MSAANDRILAVNLQSWHREIKEMYVQARRHKHGTNWSSTTVIANRGIVFERIYSFCSNPLQDIIVIKIGNAQTGERETITGILNIIKL